VCFFLLLKAKPKKKALRGKRFFRGCLNRSANWSNLRSGSKHCWRNWKAPNLSLHQLLVGKFLFSVSSLLFCKTRSRSSSFGVAKPICCAVSVFWRFVCRGQNFQLSACCGDASVAATDFQTSLFELHSIAQKIYKLKEIKVIFQWIRAIDKKNY
jgi:hypothetical protein